MATDKQLTSNSQTKADTKPAGKAPAKTPAKAPVTAKKEEVKKEAAKAPEKPAVAKKEEPKRTVLLIDDISSPTLEVFNLKQKGKIHTIYRREDLEKMGLPVWDDTKFAKRNNYTALVKHELMEMLKAGKIEHLRYTLGYAENGVDFPKVKIEAPAPKKEKAPKNSTSDFTPDAPVDLGDLNYG